jgi:hypothetical protein
MDEGNKRIRISLDEALVGAGSLVLLIDAAVTPLVTDGKTTLHEYLGLTHEYDSKLVEVGAAIGGLLYNFGRAVGKSS